MDIRRKSGNIVNENECFDLKVVLCTLQKKTRGYEFIWNVP